MGVPGVPWHTQYLADQLTLFQPGGTDYTHLITTGTPGFSDLPTALNQDRVKIEMRLQKVFGPSVVLQEKLIYVWKLPLYFFRT